MNKRFSQCYKQSLWLVSIVSNRFTFKTFISVAEWYVCTYFNSYFTHITDKRFTVVKRYTAHYVYIKLKLYPMFRQEEGNYDIKSKWLLLFFVSIVNVSIKPNSRMEIKTVRVYFVYLRRDRMWYYRIG